MLIFRNYAALANYMAIPTVARMFVRIRVLRVANKYADDC